MSSQVDAADDADTVDTRGHDHATAPATAAPPDDNAFDHAHAAEHSHEHAHTAGGETHSHEHAHALVDGDAATHGHAHLHAYVDPATIPRPSDDVAPADRVVSVYDATAVDAASTEIRYVGTSGLKVTVLDGLESHGRLERLTLRSCLLSEMTGVAAHGHTLVYLELYDNQIRSLRGVDACPNLEVLDVSYNGARSLEPVAVCSRLTELYVACNKLREISGIEKLEALSMADLGGNRIRKMEKLPPNVKKLFLGKNKIETIEGVGDLANLEVLDVQSNRLTSLDGAFPAGSCAKLRELYLAHNAIVDPSIETLEPLQNLDTVDLSHNRLEALDAFAPLKALGDLWLSYNRVPRVEAVEPLAGLGLTCLYLDHNPCAAEPRYARYLRDFFPTLEQLDANYVPTSSPTSPASPA
mmetsp:Transcript_19259/g.59279  ORF Transcript_19259/g.59279 Transcript_19259/m.59279 type:complete len:412 (+) Transcript_19259:125-1360(+)